MAAKRYISWEPKPSKRLRTFNASTGISHAPRITCPWCELKFIPREWAEHESTCPSKPRGFQSTDRKFGPKHTFAERTAPEQQEAPELRIATVTFADMKTYCILQDDIYALRKKYPDKVNMVHAYIHRGMRIQCFMIARVDIMSDQDVALHDETWESINKAKKAGARLT